MRKHFINLILLSIISYLVYKIVKDIDFRQVFYLIKNINFELFLLAFFILGLSFVFWAFRWKMSLKTISKRVRLPYVLKVLFAGVFINTITPGAGMGGEPVRAYYLSTRYKRSKTEFFGATLADKTFNLIAQIVIITFSLLFIMYQTTLPIGIKIFLQTFLIVILAIILTILFLRYKKSNSGLEIFLKLTYKYFLRKRFRSLKSFREYFHERIKKLVKTYKKVVIHRRIPFYGISMAFAYWMMYYTATYVLYLSFGQTVSFLSVLIVVSISRFVGDVSPTPGGVGVTEATMFLLYSFVGIPNYIAISVTLLDRAMFYFYALLVGGISLGHLRITEDS